MLLRTNSFVWKRRHNLMQCCLGPSQGTTQKVLFLLKEKKRKKKQKNDYTSTRIIPWQKWVNMSEEEPRGLKRTNESEERSCFKGDKSWDLVLLAICLYLTRVAIVMDCSPREATMLIAERLATRKTLEKWMKQAGHACIVSPTPEHSCCILPCQYPVVLEEVSVKKRRRKRGKKKRVQGHKSQQVKKHKLCLNGGSVTALSLRWNKTWNWRLEAPSTSRRHAPLKTVIHCYLTSKEG